jgi:hypothetical protein
VTTANILLSCLGVYWCETVGAACRAKHADRLLEDTLFAQAWQELRRLKPVTLRRAWANEHHGWQKRAFFVKFAGEGVIDNGGPYRALLVDIISELQVLADNVRYDVVDVVNEAVQCFVIRTADRPSLSCG